MKSDPHALGRTASRVSWVLQLLAAAILAQTLFFKFTAAPESVHIFTVLGLEPWGRIGSGVVELAAVILLLIPRTVALGALAACGAMTGALAAHATRLGVAIVVAGESDGGLLFALAWTTLLAAAIVLGLRRRELPFVGARPAFAR
jgi:hypothetical protein